MTSAITSRTDSPEWRRNLLWLLFIFVATVVLYRISFGFGFVYDDHEQVVSNPALQSWANARAAWTQQLWMQSKTVGSFYRPFFILWSYLNLVIFKLRPAGWHVVAVLLHATTSCGVFALGRKLKLRHWTAGLAALVFAAHPVHVEAVSWISASADPLATAFFVFGFVAFLTAREKPGRSGWVWVGVAMLFSALAVFTKEFGITFPGVVIAYVWLTSSGSSYAKRLQDCVLAGMPFVAVDALYIVARSYALRGVTPAAVLVPASVKYWLLTLPSVLALFLKPLLFPVGLNAFYYTPWVTSADWKHFGAPLLLVVIIVAIAWWAFRKNEVLSFSCWWMVLTLCPVFYLPAMTYASFVRDRYLYVPSVGFAILMAVLLAKIPMASGERPYVWQVAAAALVVCALAVTALIQQTYWVDDLSLGYRGYSQNPENVIVEVFYADHLRDTGHYDLAERIAAHIFTEDPQDSAWYYDQAYYSLALTDLKAGKLDEAKQNFEQAMAHDRNRDSAVSLERKAAFYGSLGDFTTALQVCDRVMQIDPDSYEVVYNCGYTHLLARDYSGAERLLIHAAQVGPGMAVPHFYLGQTLLHEGRVPEAIRELETAAAIEPRQEDLHAALAVAFEMQGNPQAAIREYRTELAYHPTNKAASQRLTALSGQAER